MRLPSGDQKGMLQPEAELVTRVEAEPSRLRVKT
jgi:hypothetical protein